MDMPNRYLRWTLSVIIMSLVGFLGYVLTGKVRSNAPPPSVTSDTLKTADAGMEGFVYRQTESGVIRWEVEAQKAEIFEAEHQAVLQVVQVTMFERQGKEMTIQADGGTINTETSEFDLQNHQNPIVIKLANGYTIFTPHLHWSEGKQEVNTETPVTIEGHGMTITGNGLIGHFDTEEFTLLENVRVRVAS